MVNCKGRMDFLVIKGVFEKLEKKYFINEVLEDILIWAFGIYNYYYSCDLKTFNIWK